MKKYNVIALVLTLVLILSSCVAPKRVETKIDDAMTDKERTESDRMRAQEERSEGKIINYHKLFMDFGIRTIKAAKKDGESIAISPMTIISALTMAGFGGDYDEESQTMTQIKDTLGARNEPLMGYFSNYYSSLDSGVSFANSIWVKDKLAKKLNHGFYYGNKDWLKADTFKVPFDDTTRIKINDWAKEKTDGKISEIINEISQDSLLYLVSLVTFDRQWEKPMLVIGENKKFVKNRRDLQFTTESGEKKEVVYLYSKEDFFLEDENSTGFMKLFKGGRYAFIAVVPNIEISFKDYLSDLNGEKLYNLIKNPQIVAVYTDIPRFKHEYSVDLKETLKKMGIKKAFDSSAELNNISDSSNDIYISKVLNKSIIDLNENGANVASANAIETKDECVEEIEDIRELRFDRPFLYMIYDMETGLVLFMGTVEDFK